MKSIAFILFLVGVSLSEDVPYSHSTLLFSSDLYKQYALNNDGNFILCPLSAHTILSLATVGGQGNTVRELSKALYLPENVQEIENEFETLSKNVEGSDAYQLLSANKIFVNDTISIKKEFQEIAQSTFQANVDNINFSNNKEAADKINKWVESKTDNKIKDLVKEDALDSNTALVMVNALYFRGYWVHEFGTAYGRVFHRNKTDSVLVKMMGQRNHFNYYYDKSLNAEFLEMPFKGNDVVMTFVLPKEIDGLANLEQDISTVLAVDKFSRTDAVVSLPKFKLESDVDLKPLMQSLGIVEPFTTSANFKGISDLPLLIDQILQKTFIDVNEKGVTAAAATSMKMIPFSAPKAFFVADHPFLFYLRHKVYGIFFVGRYCNP